MTGPTLAVDTAALDALAREFAGLSEELSRGATVNEHSPVTDQPSGKAVSALTASANHMTGACADGLLSFGESVAAAARMYRSTDSAGAERRIVLLCLAAAVLAACHTTAPPQDRAQDTPTSSVNVRPAAPTPPGLVAFPDFNDFQQADVDAYSGKNSHDDTFVTFRTASGMSCFAYIYKTPALGTIECDSKSMPGFPADAKGQELRESAGPGTTFTNSVLRMDSASPFEFRITRNPSTTHARNSRRGSGSSSTTPAAPSATTSSPASTVKSTGSSFPRRGAGRSSPQNKTAARS